MKLLLIGLVLVVAWDAGFGVLTAACIAGFLLIQIGARNIRDGDIRGKEKIALGVGVGVFTLAAALLKLAFVCLAWVSLTTVFPSLLPFIKETLARLF